MPERIGSGLVINWTRAKGQPPVDGVETEGAPSVPWLVKIIEDGISLRRLRLVSRAVGSPPSGSTEALRSGTGWTLGALGAPTHIR